MGSDIDAAELDGPRLVREPIHNRVGSDPVRERLDPSRPGQPATRSASGDTAPGSRGQQTDRRRRRSGFIHPCYQRLQYR